MLVELGAWKRVRVADSSRNGLVDELFQGGHSAGLQHLGGFLVTGPDMPGSLSRLSTVPESPTA